ncbi:MAG: zinc metallopeptidase [Pseudomonadota bacterium]
MPWLLLVILLLAVMFLPSWWVRHVMRKYAQPEDRYEGTGAQLARSLLDRLGMEHVGVEETGQGDHYDPTEKMVRLSPDHFNGHSLTAVTVAAHEVGHAIQDFDGYRPLDVRTKLAVMGSGLSRVASLMVIAGPLAALLLRQPALSWVGLALGAGGILFAALLHLITLPVEFDASFGRAMPLLEKGKLLHENDYPHARKILRAAAMTYVAQALIGIATAWRWLRLPR